MTTTSGVVITFFHFHCNWTTETFRKEGETGKRETHSENPTNVHKSLQTCCPHVCPQEAKYQRHFYLDSFFVIVVSEGHIDALFVFQAQA